MITIVVGAQYGGEGKGKICSYLGWVSHFEFVCRTGGVNSSHTVHFGDRTHRLRMMPASAAVQRSKWVFGAGSLIHIPTLFDEISDLKCRLDDLMIDPNAGVVTDDCVNAQRADERYASLGSTLTGTGYASAERCRRRLPLAREFEELRPYLRDVSEELYSAANANRTILLEGHQGVGLSNYHGDYPYTSSRDCIASALMAEVGLGPRLETEVCLAMKVFPTRNAAGRLPNEMTTEDADALGITEFGGGSWGIPDGRRRVAHLDMNDIKRAVRLNTPNYLAITGFDYLYPELKGAQTAADLTDSARDFLYLLKSSVGVPVGIVSTGPEVEATIDLRESPGATVGFDQASDPVRRSV